MTIKDLTINGTTYAKYGWDGDVLHVHVVEKLMKHENVMASNENIIATVIGMHENHPYTEVKQLKLEPDVRIA